MSRTPAEAAAAVRPPEDDAEFWDAADQLKAVRDWARARRLGPFSLLTEILMRVVCRVPPNVVLPPLGEWGDDDKAIGTASLNQITALVGPSGLFKGYAHLVGSRVVQWPDWTSAPVYAPLGSGQGVAATYVACKRNKDKSFEMVRLAWSALFTATEVDKMAALASAKQSTLSSTLRQLWSGEPLGEGNASEETRRYVPRDGYRAGVVIHAQPDRCGALLNSTEAGGGTPQRILWLPSRDADIPDTAPAPPRRIEWNPPPQVKEALALIDPDMEQIADLAPEILPVASVVLADVDRAAVARHRGQVAALDGHSLMVREKLAATLGLWLGHWGITDQDWQLAGWLMAKSDRTRQEVLDDMRAAMDRENTAQGIGEASRARIVRTTIERDELQAACDRITAVLTKYVGRDDGWMIKGELQAQCSRHSKFLAEAMERLIESGRIEVQEVKRQRGPSGHAYRLARG